MHLFDASAYIGDWATERLAFSTPQALLAEMDRLGIAQALVCHTLAWQNSPALGNARLMDELAGQPRLEPAWVVMPGEPGDGPAALCAQMAAHGVRAVRLCPRDHVYPLNAWMAGDLLSALAQRRYLVLLDVDQVVLPTGLFDVDPSGWNHIAWMAETYPDLAILLTRVGYRALRVLRPLMRRCPNLFLDLSYFATHQGVETIVAEFGAERLVFGTSQPLLDAGGSLARLAYAEVTPGQRELMAHLNLDRLLGCVDVPRPPLAAQWALTAQPIDGRNLKAAGLDVVDAHAHVGPYRNFHIPENGAAGLVKVMDRCGIALACLSAHMALGPDWIAGNRLTAEAVAQFPGRLLGHAAASPHQPERVAGELALCFDQLGLRAVKLHPDLAGYPVDGEGYRPAWDFAAERGSLVLVHTFHGSRYCDPPMLGKLAERYPHTPILLVHSGSMTAAFPGAVAVARAHANLYLDVSGSYITGAWIARMVREAGADRVIFSSDIPFIDLRYSLGRVLSAGLNPAEQALVLGGNIRRLLGLAAALAA
jgi:uncharacterized protein